MLFLQVLFFIIIFIIGVIKVVINFSRKKKISKIGLAFIAVPMLISAYLFIYNIISNDFFVKPTKSELVGRYHLVDATVKDFDKSSYKKYLLVLNEDNTFTLTTTPYIDICENGKYEFDYSNYYNEIFFKCNQSGYPAHIDRHLNYFRIEFIIGDPDTGESIFFEKDKY
jgi:hypothetical protein